MRILFITILILCFYLIFSENTFAKESDEDNKLNCIAKHLDTGKVVIVKTSPAIKSKNVATAQWPLGYPTIVIDNSAFLKLPKNARQFVYYHECAHLKFNIKDEFETDCKALELIKEKHKITKIQTRKLVETLVKEFGMSRRWSELLQCKIN